MRRFWLEKTGLSVGDEVEISGEEFRHICTVCRMRPGSRFEVLNSEGKAFLSEMLSVAKKTAVIALKEVREVPQQEKPWLHLCVTMPRFSTFELILEKSVELGVKSVYPLLSDFSFVKEAKKISSSKQERWQKIITSATRQTGRGDIMKLQPVADLRTLVANINPNQGHFGLFPYEGKSAMPFAKALGAWSSEKHQEIFLFVGSEGGFSLEEVQYFQEHGIFSSTLGDQVLRVETACLALISIIKYHTGQLQ